MQVQLTPAVSTGLTAKLMETTQTMADVYLAFDQFTKMLAAKASGYHPVAPGAAVYVCGLGWFSL